MERIANAGNGGLVAELAAVIVENKAWLSEIDGKIGDGDHGVNMAKGFGRTAERLEGGESLAEALSVLSDVLMSEIGGSMGPLYGMMFSGMAEAIEGAEEIDAEDFGAMLQAGLDEVRDIGSAEPGDKTLLDAYVPAVDAYGKALAAGSGMSAALEAMCAAAEAGRDATIDMVAKVGRAARLGERSRGVQDAGATSCALILCALAKGTASRLSDA
ncbi:dihydroxyacetone kinase subunit DhaL [Tropicimonas sp. IMCC6043]|uniref:dihydroxyacetone kinase subunit DhaL n=1 Tax=Tropicimonas sp. IMCC6043 TaxID=2510645 RepID=UPI00101B6A52|nr:dihydroxyacetone kinase subunit DhaL [Tropicimonas sp. IMCC6043]RYH11596.1 dihydroxyacetone kinase subunit L [Tropicimonas sp. IMCC6043]